MYTVNNNEQDLSTNLVDIVGIGSETLREDVDDRFTQIFNDIVLVASKVTIEKKTTCAQIPIEQLYKLVAPRITIFELQFLFLL